MKVYSSKKKCENCRSNKFSQLVDCRHCRRILCEKCYNRPRHRAAFLKWKQAKPLVANSGS
jgi:hypothetical protein